MQIPRLLLSALALLAVQSVPGNAVAVPRAKRNASTVGEYTLPKDSLDPLGRAAALAVTRAGFTYGPPVAGGPYYPSGVLGSARAAADLATLQADLTAEEILTAEDSASATAGSLAGKVRGSSRKPCVDLRPSGTASLLWRRRHYHGVPRCTPSSRLTTE